MFRPRCAVLMLAAWYFIMPPTNPRRVPPGHPPYLGNWKTLRTFDNADACGKFAAALRAHTHEMMARRTLARAMCVSSDDPRLDPDSK
jgi:hypothetical protein